MLEINVKIYLTNQASIICKAACQMLVQNGMSFYSQGHSLPLQENRDREYPIVNNRH